MEIHPAYDVDTNTWFWGPCEARTIRELCEKLGMADVKDYYPNGYGKSVLGSVLRKPPLRIASPPVPTPTTFVMIARGVDNREPPKARCTMRAESKPIKWTNNELDLLRSMADGGYSYRTIANKLGRSRNSTIGKARRLGLRNLLMGG